MKQINPAQQLERTDAVDNLERELNERFGLLLTVEHLAELLHRSEQGLRWSLSQPSEFADAINATRVKIGRRSYYRSAAIALLLAGEVSA